MVAREKKAARTIENKQTESRRKVQAEKNEDKLKRVIKGKERESEIKKKKKDNAAGHKKESIKLAMNGSLINHW